MRNGAPSSPSTLPERILLRGPNPVGDLVLATASFAAVRRAFPRARITLLLKPGREGVVEGAEWFDDLLVDESSRGPRAFLRLVRELRERSYDLAVLFTHSLRSAAAVALAGIPEVVGYPKGGQGFLLSRAVEPARSGWLRWEPRPMTEIYARLAEAVGAPGGGGRPTLAVPPDLELDYRRRRGELRIAEGERLLGVVPGAAFGASKLWPPARLATLADALARRYGTRTIVLTGPGEEAIARALLERMETPAISTAESPLGLRLLKPFVRDLLLLVTMDTGPRHYATAFRVPTVVIMGPTHPAWTACHLELQEVVRRDVPCGPCHLPVCPLDHRCMTGIAPEDVLGHVAALERRADLAPV